MRMYDIIERKRNGHILTKDEIKFFIEGYTNDTIPDYQMSALLMAIYFQGMTTEESAILTTAMVHSGDTVDLSNILGIKVDKHSTGGVGDTTTLILAPLVASVGVHVAKMSGRGLGHTGGTIDKLESITGFHTEITNDEFVELVNTNHLAVIGQSEHLVPADKKLYSLRDVTATVNSIPLIASSIMSKKIASGADAIVLDVKTGSGAFMEEEEDAKQLARTMVDIGNRVGKETLAIISSMNQPLGMAIGNALEVKEAIETLKGKGPKDLTELSLELGSQMVVLAKKTKTKKEARIMLEENLYNGQAISNFKTLIESQGGNGNIVEDVSLLPKAPFQFDIQSGTSGYVIELIANRIGKAALLLGAGRKTKESIIDLSVGILLHKKLGDKVEKGDTLFTIHANSADYLEVKKLLLDSIKLGDNPIETQLIIDTME